MTISQSRSFSDSPKLKTALVSSGWFSEFRFTLDKLKPHMYFRTSAATPPTFEHFALSGIHRELVNILAEIQVISNKIRNDDQAASVENDWKFAAMVLDRMCLITFSLFTILATIGVLTAAPHVIVK